MLALSNKLHYILAVKSTHRLIEVRRGLWMVPKGALSCNTRFKSNFVLSSPQEIGKANVLFIGWGSSQFY